MSFISDLFAGGIKGVLDSGTKLIEQFHLSPEQAQEFEKWKAQAAIDLQTHLEDTAAKDRDSARQREMAVKDRTPATLAYIVVGGFIGISFAQFAALYIWPDINFPPQAWVLIGNVSGYMASKSELALAYYFGTSASSGRKDATIQSMVQGK